MRNGQITCTARSLDEASTAIRNMRKYKSHKARLNMLSEGTADETVAPTMKRRKVATDTNMPNGGKTHFKLDSTGSADLLDGEDRTGTEDGACSEGRTCSRAALHLSHSISIRTPAEASITNSVGATQQSANTSPRAVSTVTF